MPNNEIELKVEEFKKELKALLEKYDVGISCDIDGDTHGVTCTMEVDIHFPGKGLLSYHLCDGYEVYSNDIKV